MSVTEAEVEIATRIFCHGIPMDIDPRSMTLAGLIAKGRCMAPDCKCWEPGKEVARAALTAAASARWRPIEEALAAERERCAKLLEQVTADDDDSDIGERASYAFNELDRETMSKRLRAWNAVLAEAIRALPSPPETER